MVGRILFVVVAVAAFAIDRVLKLVVQDQLDVGEYRQVLGDLLQLHHVQNPGIAFGWLSGAGGLVVVGSLVVGVLLFTFMLRVDPDDLLTVIGGALITGGALGNLVDRVQHSYVTDYLQLPNFPTFNFADACITVGVIMVLLAQLLAILHERRAAATPDDGE
ncbi:MAG: signal peptidase II [Thermoleophilia bacterium]|nr:signal peptidase II [Thermoleophilia bacterium]